MLNSNDSAMVIKSVANDLIRREKSDILGMMDASSKINFVNSVRTLNEVSVEIERELVRNDDLLFITSSEV